MVSTSTSQRAAGIEQDSFGRLADGTAVHRWSLTHVDGFHLQVISLGAVITRLNVPFHDASADDVVLGFDTLEPYLSNAPYFGAVVGRYANRLAESRFTLEGVDYDVDKNHGAHTLHGGAQGLHQKLWQGDPAVTAEGPGIKLSCLSPDGEGGFPGSLKVEVKYSLAANRRLVIDYYAQTDRPTPVNLTQHSYFNLAGHAAATVLDHQLQVNADYFTPVDAALIPTGEILRVAGTGLDLRSPQLIGDVVAEGDSTIRQCNGLDHNYVLRRGTAATSVAQAAVLQHPQTRRQMRVLTDQPGMQVYTGNSLGGGSAGKGGAVYSNHAAIALETQHFPNAPNNPHFPRTILMPGEEFRSRTVYAFEEMV